MRLLCNHFWSLITLLILPWNLSTAAPQQPARADVSKSGIELSPKALIAQHSTQPNVGKGETQSQPDFSKSHIDGPPKAVLAQPAIREDISKGGMEGPFKNFLAGGVPAEFQNPKVQPGKVRWHRSLAWACDAAKNSGKPVLLFHLMGKLDDQFC